ncbi:MAG: hypothetical protein ACXABV_10390 [Candidatus Thorarchaeota archaeon]|jgi:hypothetical protein
MTEIPMADDSGIQRGARPREVTMAGYLMILNAIAGIITGGLGFAVWEDVASGAGLILGVIAIFLYFQILKQDRMSWTLSVVFLIAGALLYAYGENWAGVALTAITIVYYILPTTSQHFT